MLKLDFDESEICNRKSKILKERNYKKNRILKNKKISSKDILKYKGSRIWEGNLNDMREDK